MATYRLRRVTRLTAGTRVHPKCGADANDIFVTRWRLSDGRVVSQEVTAEEYATRSEKNPGPMPNRTGDPEAVYLGGWSEYRFDTPSGRLEPGDVFDTGAELVLRLPGVRAGFLRVPVAAVAGDRADVRTLRLDAGRVSLRDGVATVAD